MSTGLSRYPAQLVESQADALRNAFYPLMDDTRFNTAITYGPNDVKKVKYRFGVAWAMFEEVLGAHSA